MTIQIEYLSIQEAVYIRNDGTDPKVWSRLYSFICDYLPAKAISFSSQSMSFSWYLFLSIKGNVGQYLRAHRDQITVTYTPEAKQKLLAANDTSYDLVTKLEPFNETQIQAALCQAGFVRKLTNNQMNNLLKIAHLPGAATFSVPGAGKTTEALAYYFINARERDRLLVVAPINAFAAWDEQLRDCVPSCSECFVRLRGGEIIIRQALRNKPRFMLISYDQLPRVKSVIGELLSSGNIFMFLDESHKIKGGKQVKRAESILQYAHLPKRKLLMSGTPLPQGPKDLLSQFSFLYPTKDASESSVIDLMQPIYVRTTKGQLGIPSVTHVVKTVKMGELQREIYKTLKSELRRQLTSSIDDSSRFALRKIGKCVLKVMEFVSNPALLAADMTYAFDQRVGRLLLESDGPKIAYVCQRARELASQGKKVIIWSCFVRNVELIAMRLSDLGAEYIHGGVDAGDEMDIDTREGKIKRFHDDNKCFVLVANPAACSEGISLHRVCQNAIYLDRSFNAAHYLQSEDRIHRLGLPQDAHPYVEFVECEDSIDQVVRMRLEHKVSVMADALNDSSLRVDIDVEDDEDVEEAMSGLDIEDARAIIDYFFADAGDLE